MYSIQEVEQFAEKFVDAHINGSETNTLRQHVLHEKVFISLCEKTIFPTIDENFQTTLKTEKIKLEKIYVEKQCQYDQNQKEVLRQNKLSKQQELDRSDDLVDIYNRKSRSLRQQILENAASKEETLKRLSARSNSHHHGRESQADSHHHGRESQTDSHQHGHPSLPDLSEFDRIDQELRKELEALDKKILDSQVTNRQLNSDIREIDVTIEAINSREKNYPLYDNLLLYLNENFRGQMVEDQGKLERRLKTHMMELKQKVRNVGHGLFLVKLRSNLTDLQSKESLGEQKTKLLQLVERIFARKESIAKLTKQLKEMRSTHRQEAFEQEKKVRQALDSLQKQQDVCDRLKKGIQEKEQFLSGIPQKIKELQQENSQLLQEMSVLTKESPKLQEIAQNADSTYQRVKKYCLPIVYASLFLALVSIIPLVISSLPAVMTTAIVVMSLSLLATVVAGGINLGYSLSASSKEKTYKAHTDLIEEKEQTILSNTKNIEDLQSKQITLPKTIEKDNQTLAQENLKLDKVSNSLQQERQKHKDITGKHRKEEQSLETQIQKLKDTPFEDGVKVSDLSIFTSQSVVVSTNSTENTYEMHSSLI